MLNTQKYARTGSLQMFVLGINNSFRNDDSDVMVISSQYRKLYREIETS